MYDRHHVELYRQDGANARLVRLTVKPDGAVVIDAQDTGEYVERTWGDSDYEFWVDIPAGALAKLVFALLRDRYAGQPGAVDNFRDFCRKEQIDHKWDSWV
jgi:hypothetical protein